MKPRPIARVLVALSAAACVLASATARADDDEWSQYDRKYEDRGMLGYDAFATRWSQMPRLTLQGSSAPRRFVGLASPGEGGLTTYGAGLDWGFRINGFVIRMLDLRYSSALAGQSGFAQVDDRRVGVHAGPLQLVEVGAPFLGVVPFSGMGGQIVRKRWKTEMSVNTGWAYAWAGGTVTGPGAAVSTGTMTSMSLFVRPELDACVHVGELVKQSFSSWACLMATTSVYEFGWFRSSSVGIRFDM
jgi:hypothetical protein